MKNEYMNLSFYQMWYFICAMELGSYSKASQKSQYAELIRQVQRCWLQKEPLLLQPDMMERAVDKAYSSG